MLEECTRCISNASVRPAPLKPRELPHTCVSHGFCRRFLLPRHPVSQLPGFVFLLPYCCSPRLGNNGGDHEGMRSDLRSIRCTAQVDFRQWAKIHKYRECSQLKRKLE
eukprot:scpid98568/ scgid15389/ 